MDLTFEIMAALAIFFGTIIFRSGWDDRPRLDRFSMVYRRKLKMRIFAGVMLSAAGAVYLIKY